MPKAGERTRFDPKKGYRVHTSVSSRETKGHIRQHRPGDIAKDSCDKRSYRTVPKGTCAKITFCCPKGKWNLRGKKGKQCRGGPKKHQLLIPKEGKCKNQVKCARRGRRYNKGKRKCEKIE